LLTNVGREQGRSEGLDDDGLVVVVAVETVPEDRPTDVTQQRAQLAREARTVLAPAAGATAPAAAAVVLVVVVTAPATAALAPAAPTLGPVGPTLGESVRLAPKQREYKGFEGVGA